MAAAGPAGADAPAPATPPKPAPKESKPAPAAPSASAGPKPAPDESSNHTPPKPSTPEPPRAPRKVTTEKSGALVDKPGADGSKPRNGSTSVDISDISKGKLDVSYNYNLATIKQTLPILGAAGGGSGAGVFIELSASAGLFANGQVEVPPGEETWSAGVKGGIALNATAAIKGGVQLNAGPVSAEATISAYAKADATAGCGIKVQGKGTKWEIAGRDTGIEADVSASVGVAATLQAGLPGFSVGQTWNIAGPFTLPIVHASYPIEGAGSIGLSPEVKALPGKVASGISGLVDKIAASAKQAVDDTVDSITGLDEKRKQEDAERSASITALNDGWAQWAAWKDEIGWNTGGKWNEVGRNATSEEVESLNSYGTKFVGAYESQQKMLALGSVAAGYEPVMASAKVGAKVIADGIKSRVAVKKAQDEAAKKAKLAAEAKAREEIIAAQTTLKGRVMDLAKAHDNLNYQGKKALDRGVTNGALHPHFDPANNAYMPLYTRAMGVANSQTATVADCGSVQAEVEALIGTTRKGAEAIKGLS